MVSARRYRVTAMLGQGAFGAVYLAETVGTGLERRVAIKVLKPERAATPGLVGRLRDEARMLALIRHRAIVRVDDLVELDGNWSIIMEYVEGCDVTELLRDGPVPPRAALAVAEEVASALHAAYHQPGPDGSPLRLIHRDIKPSNLRVTAQGDVKILDFGVARAEFADREEATTEASFGTIPYMAPERFQGEDTHAGDVYALGVTLFEMLTGLKPGRTAMDDERAPPGGRLAAHWDWLSNVTPQLHDLVAAMLAREPQHRPNARECVRILEQVRAALSGEALDEWSERVVPECLRKQEQRRPVLDRTNTILFERPESRAPPAKRSAMPAWLAGGAAVALGMLLASGIIGVTIWWASTRGSEVAVVTGAPVVGARPLARPGVTASAPTAKAGSQTKPGAKPSAGTTPAAVPVAAVPGAVVPTAAAAGTTAPLAAKPGAATEAPRPTKPTAATQGRLALAGDAQSVELTGSSGLWDDGELPPGTYVAKVTFVDGAVVTVRDVVVEAGITTTLRCSASFGNCKVVK